MTEELTLTQLKNWAEQVQGNWDGNESGLGEERADIAGNIITAINVIENLLKEIDELN